MTGGRVGNWMLGEEIGRGPLGCVYRGQSTEDGRIAVVKILTPDPTRPPDFLPGFTAAMLFLQRLHHPNIARFYESGVSGGMAFYATEAVDGTDLASALRNRTRKPDEPGLSWTDDLLRVAVQLTRALRHGHHRSILHRGIKPANVLLATDGTVKLTDFGIGKLLGPPPLSLSADAWGTAGFLAPEHFTGKPFTKRSDLYALGGVLYTLVTGRPPFTGASAAEFMHKHCYTLPERPIQFVPKLPPELDDLICGLLAKEPSRRPANAAVVLDQLDRIRGKLERKGVSVVWPTDPGDTTESAPLNGEDDRGNDYDERPDRPLMSRPIVVIPAFLLVVGLLLAGLFWPHPGPEELWAQAVPLLESTNPDDWDRAWNEYLEPLGRRYPDSHREELATAARQLATRRELKRAVETGSKIVYASEAEHWYYRGLALVRSGDLAEAQKVWSNLIPAFSGLEADARWVVLAQRGLDALGPVPHTGSVKSSLAKTVEHLQELRKSGDTAGADRIQAALEALYADDPDTLNRIRAEP